jgi:NADH:ubiquinone oxidoreductase subunit E
MKPLVRSFTKVCTILDKHHRDARKLIPILQEVQSEYRYLPEDVMYFVATSLNISAATIFGVATFFENFALEPKGQHILRICDGTACHVKGSEAIIDGIKEHLHLLKNEKTTADMNFTVETVSCIGACSLAPVVTIDQTVFGQTNTTKIIEGLKELKNESC